MQDRILESNIQVTSSRKVIYEYNNKYYSLIDFVKLLKSDTIIPSDTLIKIILDCLIILRRLIPNDVSENIALLALTKAKTQGTPITTWPTNHKTKDNILHLAIIYAYNKLAVALCDEDVNTSSKNISGDTPLDIAFKNCRLTVIEALLKKAPSVQLLPCAATSKALWIALQHRNQSLAILLAERGADINAENLNYHYSVLAYAMKQGCTQFVYMMLAEYSKKLSAHSLDDLVLEAVNQGHVEIKEIALAALKIARKEGKDANSADDTAPHCAVRKGRAFLVNLLCAFESETTFERSAIEIGLFAALKQKRINIAFLLLEKAEEEQNDRIDTYPYQCPETLDTILHLAVMCGHLALVEALWKRGASVFCALRNTRSKTPLDIALANLQKQHQKNEKEKNKETNNFVKIICFFLENDKTLIQDENRKYAYTRAYHLLIKYGYSENLLENTSDPDYANRSQIITKVLALNKSISLRGNTTLIPLAMKVPEPNLQLIAQLLQHDAEIARDDDCTTLLHLAIGKDDVNLAIQALKQGAKVNECPPDDKEGENAFVRAIRLKRSKLVDHMLAHQEEYRIYANTIGARVPAEKVADVIHRPLCCLYPYVSDEVVKNALLMYENNRIVSELRKIIFSLKDMITLQKRASEIKENIKRALFGDDLQYADDYIKRIQQKNPASEAPIKPSTPEIDKANAIEELIRRINAAKTPTALIKVLRDEKLHDRMCQHTGKWSALDPRTWGNEASNLFFKSAKSGELFEDFLNAFDAAYQKNPVKKDYINFKNYLAEMKRNQGENSEKNNQTPAIPAEAVIASPAFFAGSGNPALLPSESPRSQKTLARDDDDGLSAGAANETPGNEQVNYAREFTPHVELTEPKLATGPRPH